MIGRINANIFALLTHSAQFDVSGLNRVEYLFSTHMAKSRFCHMLSSGFFGRKFRASYLL